MPCKCTILRGTQQPGLGDKCLSFNSASRQGGHSHLLPAVPIRGRQPQSPDRGDFGLASFPLTSTHKQDCPVPSKIRAAPPRPAQSLFATPSATPPPVAAEKLERSSGGAPRAAYWACSAGRGGLGCARRVGSPRPAEAAGERGESDGSRSWTHVPRGLMPRVSQPDAQLAVASATSRHRLPALPGCRGEELQPLSCSGCAHCPQGPPTGLLRGPGPAP